MLVVLFLLIAAVLFGVATFGVGAKFNLVAAGLLALTLALLVEPVRDLAA